MAGRDLRGKAPIHCRPATAADGEALAAILLEARRQAFHWLPRDTLRLDDFARETAGERITVAEVAQRAVGFLSVWEPERFVHHLFVAPHYQRRGVGSRLLACLSAAEPHRLKCAAPNAAALRFYAARGWREVDRGDDSGGAYLVLERGARARTD